VAGLPPFKAIRTAVVLSTGGEFGIAILTLLMQGRVVPAEVSQPLLVAIVLSMVVAPLLLRHNRRIARLLLREAGPARSEPTPEERASADLAAREHVILCGFGRVGQNLARVLEREGHEYIAMDLDVTRVRTARAAGMPVIYGDAADPEMLREVGLAAASAVIITFADPPTSIGILRSVRGLRADVPVLVRAADDTRLDDLMAAGATEVVPETFEASLMLASHALVVLKHPLSRVVHTIGRIRNERYASLRPLLQSDDSLPEDAAEGAHQQLKTVVLPPGAWAEGRSLDDVRAQGVAVRIDSVLRHGISGREPDSRMILQQGDELVLAGTPEDLEHAERVLLAG